jgi:ribulose 1,5-bisphosphate synthetase/thiazole synthase
MLLIVEIINHIETSSYMESLSKSSLKPKSNLSIGIVGASIAGLSAANMLHNQGAKVTVYEKYHTTMEKKGGGMGSDLHLL